ncbi:hypothetical protein GCM10011488_68570 [Steroidobacter agaridevorans]|nr:hypothetical protein GCM10011488_68570 [Steroidobacter agaridevorans]
MIETIRQGLPRSAPNGLPQQWEIPADHNEHKIRRSRRSSPHLKQRKAPAEGPSIIYEVPRASTACL